MKKYKTVSILPEIRKAKRMRARYNMLREGIKHVNKRFSLNWREYAEK